MRSRVIATAGRFFINANEFLINCYYELFFTSNNEKTVKLGNENFSLEHSQDIKKPVKNA